MCSETSILGVKKIIIIIWIILWFLLINIFSINSYYNNLEWNKLYENKDFSWALENFSKNKNYIWLYNLWNTNYRLWEQEKEDNKKIEYWEKSVDFYKNSLKLKYDPRTEYNYNFVLDKLKKLKKKQEEEKQKQEQKNNKDNKNDWNSKDWKEWEKKENWESWDKQKDWKEWSKWENSDKEDWEQFKKNWENWKKSNKTASQQGTSAPWKKYEPQLSKEAKEQIKAYEEKLKQDQKKNSWNFWKKYQENNRNDIFDNFNSFFEDDNIFDNSALNNKDEKKDW